MADELDLYGDLYGEGGDDLKDAQDSDSKNAQLTDTGSSALGQSASGNIGSAELTSSLKASIPPTSSVGALGSDTRHDSTRYIQKSADHKDEGKMFVGGLNWDTTDEGLKEYFERFGPVSHSVVMRDPESGRSRGFAFITFADNAGVDAVLSQSEHILDGKHIDPKRAVPRSESSKTDKLFVRSIPLSCTPDMFKEYFKQFGKVLDATLMMEKETENHRGFGFVNFEEGDAVDKILRSQPHYMDGQVLEVKRAQARAEQARRFQDRGNGNYNQGPGQYNSNFDNNGSSGSGGNSADPTGVTDLLTQMGLAAGMNSGFLPGMGPPGAPGMMPMPYGGPGPMGGFRGGYRGTYRGRGRGGPPGSFRGSGRGQYFNTGAGPNGPGRHYSRNYDNNNNNGAPPMEGGSYGNGGPPGGYRGAGPYRGNAHSGGYRGGYRGGYTGAGNSGRFDRSGEPQQPSDGGDNAPSDPWANRAQPDSGDYDDYNPATSNTNPDA